MSEDATPHNKEAPGAVNLSFERVLLLLALLVLFGTLGTAIFVSLNFGAGVFLGGLLSILNYYWLKSILRRFFERSEKSESAAKMAFKFILRYFAFAAVLLLVFVTGVFPVVAVLFGLAGFALAVMVEGIMSIFRPVRL